MKNLRRWREKKIEKAEERVCFVTRSPVLLFGRETKFEETGACDSVSFDLRVIDFDF